MVNESRGATLQRLLRDSPPVVAPGAFDPLTARIVEGHGFPAVYLGGWASSVERGLNDALTATGDRLEAARYITDVIDVPLIVDIENGFGEVANIRHTVRALERAGVAAVHIEDEPGKRVHYHLGETSVLDEATAIDRLKLALDSRRDDDMVIIARTDIMRVTGSVDSAIERCGKFAEAGADMVMITGPREFADAEKIGMSLPSVPKVWVGGLENPPSEFSVDSLSAVGYQLFIYGYITLWGAVLGVDKTLTSLKENGVTGYLEEDKPGLRKRIHDIVKSEEYWAIEK
jgi:2-methylisocitrate lyase-like PEP mutase family enzyme